MAAQGKYVILFFYPLDFTFVCPTEITAFSDKHAEFAKINTEVRQSCRWALVGQGSLQRLYCYSLQVMIDLHHEHLPACSGHVLTRPGSRVRVQGSVRGVQPQSVRGVQPQAHGC